MIDRDYEPGPSREDFEKAAHDLKREWTKIYDSKQGFAGYDYVPEPTAAEIWDRMERNLNPYPA